MVHLGLIGCNAVALEAVRTINAAVYAEPRLATTHHPRTTVGVRAADLRHEKRIRMRRLSEELSRYYVLPEGEVKWVRPRLLLEGEYNCGQMAS